jgi:hypothetical protein
MNIRITNYTQTKIKKHYTNLMALIWRIDMFLVKFLHIIDFCYFDRPKFGLISLFITQTKDSSNQILKKIVKIIN